MTWQFRHLCGDAVDLFAGDPLTEPVARSVTFRTVSGPTVVLGSAQSLEIVDSVRASDGGVGVVRRRSGGGAVWLDPKSITWVDVTIAAGDPLWDNDVGRAFWWLGDVWAGALGSLGIHGAGVHRGALVHSRWSKTVCFGGRGPGEVILGERKVVGISQRRTRAGALFQCGVLHTWDPAALLGVLRFSEEQRAQACDDLVCAAVGVPEVGLREAFGERISLLS